MLQKANGFWAAKLSKSGYLATIFLSESSLITFKADQ